MHWSFIFSLTPLHIYWRDPLMSIFKSAVLPFFTQTCSSCYYLWEHIIKKQQNYLNCWQSQEVIWSKQLVRTSLFRSSLSASSLFTFWIPYKIFTTFLDILIEYSDCADIFLISNWIFPCCNFSSDSSYLMTMNIQEESGLLFFTSYRHIAVDSNEISPSPSSFGMEQIQFLQLFS